MYQFSSVQSLSCVQLFATPQTAARQASQSITNSQRFLKLMSIELVMPCNHLILCPPLLVLPSIFLSIRIFSSQSALCIRWRKYGSFSFSLSSSKEYSGLISLRIAGLISLQSKGPQESSPTSQFKSSNASALNFPYGPSHSWTLWSTFHQGWASLVARRGKHLPAMREIRV